MNYSKELRQFVIANFTFGEDAGLEDDSSFLDTGIIDSTGILELITFLESTYGIRVDASEMVPENLDSINKVNSFLNKKLDHPGTSVEPKVSPVV